MNRIMKGTLTILSVVAISLLFSIKGAIAANVFGDVPANHWARSAIEWAHQNRIMTGPGGQERAFRPNTPLTRAEQAAISMRLDQKMQDDLALLSIRITRLENALALRAAQTVRIEAQQSSARSSMSEIHMSTEPVSFTARLYGSQEVPPVVSNARGSATFRMTNEGLWYDINVANLSGNITGAAFHMAEPGMNGPAVENVPFIANRAQGYWRNITTAEWRALTAGEIYINVYTHEHPSGEIRGKVEFAR